MNLFVIDSLGWHLSMYYEDNDYGGEDVENWEDWLVYRTAVLPIIYFSFSRVWYREIYLSLRKYLLQMAIDHSKRAILYRIM